MASTACVVVFTAKSVEDILSVGGSESWSLQPESVNGCEYLVCTRNRYTDWGTGREEHRSAFLIGKIAGVAKSNETEGRWLIQISKYALVNIPEIWDGSRNPVRYRNLEEIGIDISTLDLRPMPAVQTIKSNDTESDISSLTIAQAKSGLAARFGVNIDDIEITIRG